MDLNDLREHVDSRFDELRDQLSDHLQRTSKLETSVKWIATFLIVIVTGLIRLALPG